MSYMRPCNHIFFHITSILQANETSTQTLWDSKHTSVSSRNIAKTDRKWIDDPLKLIGINKYKVRIDNAVNGFFLKRFLKTWKSIATIVFRNF